VSDVFQTYNSLLTSFKKGNFEPVYFFYGVEQFLIGELQKALIDSAILEHERDFNLDIVYGQESNAAAIIGLCRSFPTMAARRLVVVRGLDQIKDRKLFAGYLEQANPSTILCLIGQKSDARMEPYKSLKKKATSAQFAEVPERLVPAWIKKRVERLGASIDDQASHNLQVLQGSNLSTLASTIENLTDYVEEGVTISTQHVLDIGGHSRKFNVFELQKMIGLRDYPSSIRIMDQMLQKAAQRQGEALMIVAVLTSFFSKLKKIAPFASRGANNSVLAKKAGVPPFYVREYLSSLNNYGNSGVDQAFRALLGADIALKGGTTQDAATILALSFGQMMRPAAQRIPSP